MADTDEVRSGVAVAEPPDSPTVDEKKKSKKDDDDLDYEVEFATPFGKLEFEFEPLAKKDKKDRERKAKAERDAAKKALQAAERAAAKGERNGGRGVLGTLMIVFLVLAIIGAMIAIAYWLFARPGEEEDDLVRPEFAQEPQPAQGLVGRARGRLRDAIRAGRSASREAQREQREKFEQMSHGA
jgi:hypothetical protein